MIQSERKKPDFDRLGSIASSICAVHCLLTGVAFGVLSVAGLGFLGSIWTDILFFGFAIVFGFFAIRSGFRKHHKSYPGYIFVAGLSSIIIGHAFFKEGTAVCTILAVGGGLALVSFHLINARLGHSCKHCALPHTQGK